MFSDAIGKGHTPTPSPFAHVWLEAYVGEGSAVRGGIWEIFLGGGVVFWPSGGGKGLTSRGGNEGGNISFGRLRRPKKS